MIGRTWADAGHRDSTPPAACRRPVTAVRVDGRGTAPSKRRWMSCRCGAKSLSARPAHRARCHSCAGGRRHLWPARPRRRDVVTLGTGQQLPRPASATTTSRRWSLIAHDRPRGRVARPPSDPRTGRHTAPSSSGAVSRLRLECHVDTMLYRRVASHSRTRPAPPVAAAARRVVLDLCEAPHSSQRSSRRLPRRPHRVRRDCSSRESPSRPLEDATRADGLTIIGSPATA